MKKGSNKVLIVTEEGKEITLEGQEAIQLAHDLMQAGEKALKRAGKWKP